LASTRFVRDSGQSKISPVRRREAWSFLWILMGGVLGRLGTFMNVAELRGYTSSLQSQTYTYFENGGSGFYTSAGGV
jgi:predicted Zn-dependent peptidase